MKTKLIPIAAAIVSVAMILSTVFPVPMSIKGDGLLSVSAQEIGEIISQRDRTSKIYYLGGKQYALDVSMTSIHYKDDPNDPYELWKDIDTTIVPSARPNWDYEVVKGNWHLLIRNDTSVAIGKAGHWIGFKYAGYGYLDWSTKQYVVLGTRQNVMPVVTDNSITWHDLFSGVDLEYVYSADGFKENLYVTQSARDWLIANPPSSYGLNNPTSYLVAGLECDWQSAYPAEDVFGVPINWDNVNEFTDDGVFWRNPSSQQIVSALPLGYAIHPDVAIEDWAKLRYRFYEDSGIHYLLLGVGVLDLNNYPSGTINLDPSFDLEVGASNCDADEWEFNGTMSVSGSTIRAYSSTGSLNRYWMGLRWSSYSLPPKGSTITVANVSVYIATDDDLNVNWHFEEDEAPATFSTGAYDITNRDRTETSTSDIEDNVGTGWHMLCGGNTTALNAPLQEVIDACSPVAIALIGRPNQDTTKFLTCYSYDQGPSYGAQLHLEWTETGWYHVGQGSDDAIEYYTGVIDVGNNWEELDNHNDWLGFRWTGVNIPSGANVTTAYVSIYPGIWDDPRVRLYAQDAYNPPTFSNSTNNITNRSITGNYTSWSADNIGTSVWRDTPSLVDEVQEVVDNNGGTGSALVILFKAQNPPPELGVYLYEYGTPARLYLEWTSAECSPSVSLNVSSWSVNDGDPVLINSEYSSGLTYFNVTNSDSGGAIDISIRGQNMTGGGYTWELSNTATPGDMVYGLKAGLSGESYNITVKLDSPYNTLVADLANNATQAWGLKLYTPTNYDDSNTKSGNITISAVCSS